MERSQQASAFGIARRIALGVADRKAINLFSANLALIVANTVTTAAVPILFSLGIDRLYAGPEGHGDALRYMALFGISLLLVNLFTQLEWLAFGPVNLRLQRAFTLHVISRILTIPLKRLREWSSHDVSQSIDRGLGALRNVLENTVFFVIPSVFEILVAAAVIALLIDIWISLALVVALVAYGAIAFVAAGRIRQTTELAVEKGIAAWSFGMDGISNAELIQQGNYRPAFLEALRLRWQAADLIWNRTFRQRSVFGSMQATVFGLVVLFILLYGANNVTDGSMTVGNLVLLNTYIIRLLQPVETFARFYRETWEALGECAPLMAIMSVPVTESQAGTGPDDRPVHLSMRAVSIAHDETQVLANLDIDIAAGSRLYVVGPSGAGKSTFLALAGCLYMPDRGDVEINGQRVTDENAASFRNVIKVVQQDCLLFDWSVADNLRFGSEASDAEIEDVIARLGLGNVIDRDRDNPDATVGERGNRLSGGERQRIALARALLGKPRLLLLDEPTSALDRHNRARVLAEIDALAKQSTVVFVTHDPTLVGPDDNVLFLSGSGQWSSGVHAKMLAEDPAYRLFIEVEQEQPNENPEDAIT